MNTNSLHCFFENIRGKKIALLGVGVSNIGLAELFASRGAIVTACDKRTREQLGDTAQTLEKAGASLRLGEDYLDGLDADMAIRSPGMYFLSPEITNLRNRGIAVTSEMELFFDLCPCKIIATTGSDGKTTTSTLIATILNAAGKTVHLGGNIGRALLPEIFNINPDDIAVVELSSFQLISMRKSPNIAVITNVTPNHLDVHADMQEYTDSKRNLYLHQGALSTTVLNLDNAATASFAPEVRGNLRMFSLEQPVQNGAFLREDGMLCAACYGKITEIVPAADIKIPGRHNVANFLAAICAVLPIATPEAVREVAKTFGGVEHRIEFVAEIDGVRWYNDSIATSPSRSSAGIAAFDVPITLIAGGSDKHIPFDPMAPLVIKHVSTLLLTGPTAPKIEAAIKNGDGYSDGHPKIIHADNIAHASSIAHELTPAGGVVLLSPACASFDSYQNFEHRGRHFKEIVKGME